MSALLAAGAALVLPQARAHDGPLSEHAAVRAIRRRREDLGAGVGEQKGERRIRLRQGDKNSAARRFQPCQFPRPDHGQRIAAGRRDGRMVAERTIMRVRCRQMQGRAGRQQPRQAGQRKTARLQAPAVLCHIK